MRIGEVYKTDFGEPDGHEQGYERPSVIVQNDSFNEALETVIVVPLTTNKKRLGYSSAVLIKAGEANLPEDSVALCHNLMTIDKKFLNEEPIGRLPRQTFDAIQKKIAGVLAISSYYKE